MSKKDSSGAKLLVWARNFVKCLKENSAVFKIDKKIIDDFEALVSKYETALKKVAGPDHRKTDIFRKNDLAREIKISSEKIIVVFVKYNGEVTQELLFLMQLNEKTRKPKMSRLPEMAPFILLEPGRGTVRARCQDPVSGRRGKPEGVGFIEYAWGLLDSPPGSVDDLPHKVMQTSGPLILNFAECDRGKPCYVAARWISTKAEPGPWSEIDKIFVG